MAILACFAQLTARPEWLMTLPIGGPEILGKVMAAAMRSNGPMRLQGRRVQLLNRLTFRKPAFPDTRLPV